MSEENSLFFDILQKALPPPVEEADDSLIEEGALVEGNSLTNHHALGNGIDSGSKK